jgi:hypothetical protein
LRHVPSPHSLRSLSPPRPPSPTPASGLPWRWGQPLARDWITASARSPTDRKNPPTSSSLLPTVASVVQQVVECKFWESLGRDRAAILHAVIITQLLVHSPLTSARTRMHARTEGVHTITCVSASTDACTHSPGARTRPSTRSARAARTLAAHFFAHAQEGSQAQSHPTPKHKHTHRPAIQLLLTVARKPAASEASVSSFPTPGRCRRWHIRCPHFPPRNSTLLPSGGARDCCGPRQRRGMAVSVAACSHARVHTP